MLKRMCIAISVVIVGVAVLLYAPAPAKADAAGTVEGVVKSSSGRPMEGAYVRVHNSEKRLTFMVVSQAQGRYTIRNLPPGKYSVQGIGDGFQSTPNSVDVASGKSANADLALTSPQPAKLISSLGPL